MPILHERPRRWKGLADSSVLALAGVDSPLPWTLGEGQLLQCQAYDLSFNRSAQRPSQFGSNIGFTVRQASGFMHARGQGYSKPLLWNEANPAQVAHYSGGGWAILAQTAANAGTGPFQGANGMGRTLLPFGGTSALREYDGTNLAVVGGTAPTGLVAVYYHRLGNRFLGFVGAEDTLRWCANNDRTAWTTGDGGSEPIGNDRDPLVAIAEGPGDMTTIFKDHYLFVIEKTDPANWNIRRKAGDRGAIGRRAWSAGPDGSLFFGHETGIWVMNGDGAILPQPLTLGIANIWAGLFADNAPVMKHLGLCYHPLFEELWVFIPAPTGSLTNQMIWRCYVPDGSWELEETTEGTQKHFPLTSLLVDPADNRVKPYYVEDHDSDNTLKVFQLDATGARPDVFLETRPAGDPMTVKAFGEAPEVPGQGRKCVVYFKARGNYNARVTTRVWREDGTVAESGPHNVSLAGTEGDPLVHEVPVPEDVGQFISVFVSNPNQDEPFDFSGFSVPYENIAVGKRRV